MNLFKVQQGFVINLDHLVSLHVKGSETRAYIEARMDNNDTFYIGQFYPSFEKAYRALDAMTEAMETAAGA